MKREFSGAIGLIGGLIDMFVGLLILQPNPMGMTGPMMSAFGVPAGYLMLVLGMIVFLTGVYVLVSRMVEHRSTVALLMIVYGAIMLVLGVGMIEQLFNIMMQGSTVSGAAMTLVGLTMLYSGSQMTRASKEKML